MSITFHPTITPPAELSELRFWCDTATTTVATAAARNAAAAHSAECAECTAYGGVLVDEVHDFIAVNLANVNAARVLRLLGYGEQDLWYGCAPAEDFLGRLLVADGLLETSDERAANVVRTRGGATLIDVGEPQGYLNERIRMLIELTQWAKANGSDICWS